ncbi:DNA-3-methyladenine glycosylase I [Acinetobacter apis]|uniref:DNA-3-methyladenine glycosylase I n=1 Tax=Acinetobacter apis TaxID=1229165 RepID=A0A217EHI7_9GAMM|nr:DNA-3-methyladenine glycosylase I [Acinetobacter apis]SNQ29650.1 DNA-3-methyladenine glycosylase I [Acinetobacter apis]
MSHSIQRCAWCTNDPIYIAYHDEEWGKPLYDEQALFELLCLEGQQAGLAWITVLKKRACYRKHFFQYTVAEIAAFTDQDIMAKLTDQGLIRHRLKLMSIRDNAIAWQQLKHQHGDMSAWLWTFTHQPIQNNDIPDHHHIPTSTKESVQLSKQLKKHGFKFVGPTICYAFMQASGMVNDHENHCPFK